MVDRLQEQAEARAQTALCVKGRSCGFSLRENGQLLETVQQGREPFRFMVQREEPGRVEG